jgi:quercetin dioxygenase-like cupin family protein
MSKASMALIHRYAGVAFVAALRHVDGDPLRQRFISATGAGGAAAKPLLVQPLGDLHGREIRITLLDRAPGSSSAPHRHPGHHTFGYVIEGSYEFAIDGQPARTLNAGETFYEPPAALHSTSRNPSADKRTKILVFMVADRKNPSTVAE